MKKNNKRGFTLAELLIVVAIIAVLVAIAIPIFNAQLEKSRDAVSISNIRSAYAEAQAAYLTGSGDGTHVKLTLTDGKITAIEVDAVAIKSQKADSFSSLGGDLPFTVPNDPGAAKNYTIKFAYSDGVITGTPTLTPAS
jgi:prepilin-type N-terminal cleavage/methylation domain-containing protein